MYNIKIFNSWPAIGEIELTKLESILGVEFPEDYRNFLLMYNGGRPRPNVFPVFGHPLSSEAVIHRFLGTKEGEFNGLLNYAEWRGERVPSDLLPIATDVGGNLICLATDEENKGKIYFWDQEEESDYDEPPTRDNIYFIAFSFTDLLTNLTDKEWV